MLPTESHALLRETYYGGDHARVGIDAFEADNFPVLPIAMPLLLVAPLWFSIGISILVSLFLLDAGVPARSWSRIFEYRVPL